MQKGYWRPPAVKRIPFYSVNIKDSTDRGLRPVRSLMKTISCRSDSRAWKKRGVMLLLWLGEWWSSDLLKRPKSLRDRDWALRWSTFGRFVRGTRKPFCRPWRKPERRWSFMKTLEPADSAPRSDRLLQKNVFNGSTRLSWELQQKMRRFRSHRL